MVGLQGSVQAPAALADLEKSMEHACLETFPQKTFQGSDIPTEMTGHQSSKALLNSLYGAEFICFEDIHPLRPTGSTRAQAATRKRSACLDLASPEIVGKLSETAWSSALDQAANYKTQLTLQAYLTPVETDSRARRICAVYKHQLVFK